MSKEAWFQHYETLYNEREAGERKGTDEELSKLASEREIDEMASQADAMKDAAKERLNFE